MYPPGETSLCLKYAISIRLKCPLCPERHKRGLLVPRQDRVEGARLLVSRLRQAGGTVASTLPQLERLMDAYIQLAYLDPPQTGANGQWGSRGWPSRGNRDRRSGCQGASVSSVVVDKVKWRGGAWVVLPPARLAFGRHFAVSCSSSPFSQSTPEVVEYAPKALAKTPFPPCE